MSRKSEVYFMDDRGSGTTTGLVAKTCQLFEHARLFKCFNKGDNVAVKIHMGEWFADRYLRPIYARAIIDKIKEHGGLPFLTDASTSIFSFGSRADPRWHLNTASANGFNMLSMGCPVIIADGTGYDDVRLENPDGVILKQAYMARAIAEADAMIVISRFKGHTEAAYGGAIKNIGIGCSSRRGKGYVHMFFHPKIGIKQWEFDGSKCRGRECKIWKMCQNQCPVDAIKVMEDRIEWDREKCVECCSHYLSPATYICKAWKVPTETYQWLDISIADAASTYVKHLGKNHVGFINFAIDITPICDCGNVTDRPFVSNIGVFASRDPVAIDTACLDKVTALPGLAGTIAEDKKDKDLMQPGSEKFTILSPVPKSQWFQPNVAQVQGIGTMNYELLEPPPTPDDEEDKFWYPDISFEKPVGWRFKKAFKIQSPYPPNFSYREKPRISLEELSKR